MFTVTKNSQEIKTTKTVGDAVNWIKFDAASQEKDCEYAVIQKNFPMPHYKRTAYDLQLEACR